MVSLPAAPSGNCAADPTADATFDALNTVGANNPNLDLTNVCMSQPDPGHYKVVMTIASLASLTPGTGAGGTTLIWQTQWHEPSTVDTTNGGALFMVYAESVGGQAPTCWAGENAAIFVGGGVELTYPGTTQLTGSACAINQAIGTITITVPKATVSVASPDSSILYSVTASTQTLPSGIAETPVALAHSGVATGGVLFNVIDAAPAFDFNPNTQTCQGPSCNIPEVPWVPLLLLAPGAAVVVVGLRRRERSRPAGLSDR
jgi:hypothetical protein